MSTCLPLPLWPQKAPDLLDRARSLGLSLRFGLSRWLRWQRRGYREVPATVLPALTVAESRRIQTLQQTYGLRLEQRYNQLHTLEGYVYLDLLDRLFDGQPPPAETLLDVGSKHFWYAPVLDAVVRPRQLIGIEIEGYRIYPDGHSRRDYAEHYLAALPQARYVVGDVLEWREPVDAISCFYPFLEAGTVLAWGLPLSVWQPARFFAHLAGCLKPGGWLLMVNQGAEEWMRANALLEQADLRCQRVQIIDDPLLPRPAPPVVSWFAKP